MENENFNVDNAGEAVENRLKEAKKSTPSYVEQARKEREEEENKRRIAETRRQLDIDDYDKEHALLCARYDKRKSALSNDRIKSVDEENGKFASGMDLNEHRENLERINKTYTDAVAKLKSEFSKVFSTLKQTYPNGYRASNRSWYDGSDN